MNTSAVNPLNIADTISAGLNPPTNGLVTINGVDLSLTSNTLTYDGINYTFKSGFDSANVGVPSIQVNKTTDTDSIFNSIKTFVDKYNEVIKSLNDKIDEKRYRDYPPLLDEQKTDMKDTEITLWENKAKSGLLSSDNFVSSILNNMRTALYTPVNGLAPIDTLREIGIKTSSSLDAYKENGKLILDEDKLKGMLQTNPEEVKMLFTKTSDIGDPKHTTANNSAKSDNSGVAWRIYDRLKDSINTLTKKVTDITGKDLTSFDKQISDWEDRLSQRENMYWKQFNAMEQAIQKSNSQSGWLAQQFG